MELEDLGEQLYNLLAQVLNRPENRAFFDSIRGEYGVLWYLLTKKEAVSAGELKEKLHVVPGRMTDILTALEKKGRTTPTDQSITFLVRKVFCTILTVYAIGKGIGIYFINICPLKILDNTGDMQSVMI